MKKDNKNNNFFGVTGDYMIAGIDALDEAFLKKNDSKQPVPGLEKRPELKRSKSKI